MHFEGSYCQKSGDPMNTEKLDKRTCFVCLILGNVIFTRNLLRTVFYPSVEDPQTVSPAHHRAPPPSTKKKNKNEKCKHGLQETNLKSMIS